MSRLYDVTITFDPKDFKETTEVEAVGISGEFLFYKRLDLPSLLYIILT